MKFYRRTLLREAIKLLKYITDDQIFHGKNLARKHMTNSKTSIYIFESNLFH